MVNAVDHQKISMEEDQSCMAQKIQNLLPFVEFLLTLESYNESQRRKMSDIHNWIKSKKSFSETNLRKMHSVIVTLYKNLMLDGVKIPEHIFPLLDHIGIKYENVNLCSDEEDEVVCVSAGSIADMGKAASPPHSEDDELIFVAEEIPIPTEGPQSSSKSLKTINKQKKDSENEILVQIEKDKAPTTIQDERDSNKSNKNKKKKKHKKKKNRLPEKESFICLSSDDSEVEVLDLRNESEESAKTIKPSSWERVENPNSNFNLVKESIAEESSLYTRREVKKTNYDSVKNSNVVENPLSDNKPSSKEVLTNFVAQKVNDGATNGLRNSNVVENPKPMGLLEEILRLERQINKDDIKNPINNSNAGEEPLSNKKPSLKDVSISLRLEASKPHTNQIIRTVVPSNNINLMVPMDPSLTKNPDSSPIKDILGRQPQPFNASSTQSLEKDKFMLPNIPPSKVNLNDPRILKQLKTFEKSPLCSAQLRDTIQHLKMEAQKKATQDRLVVTAKKSKLSTYGEFKKRRAEEEKVKEIISKHKEQLLKERLNISNEKAKEKDSQKSSSSSSSSVSSKLQEKQNVVKNKSMEHEHPIQEITVSKVLQVCENEKSVDENKGPNKAANDSKKSKELKIRIKVPKDTELAKVMNVPEKGSEKTLSKESSSKKTAETEKSSFTNQSTTIQSEIQSNPEQSLEKSVQTNNQNPQNLTRIVDSEKKIEQIKRNKTNERKRERRRKTLDASLSDEFPTKKIDRLFKELEICFDGTKQMNNEFYTKISNEKRNSSLIAGKIIAEQLNGKDIVEEYNVFSPSLRRKRKNSSIPLESVQGKKIKLSEKRKPIVKLHRLKAREIASYMKHTILTDGTHKKDGLNHDLLEVNRVEQILFKEITPNKTSCKVKKRNTNLIMTERNTKFCELCRSKPNNLSNHYMNTHKTESYVARLLNEDLDDLSKKVRFAYLDNSNPFSRIRRYKVECIFCRETIVDTFSNFHSHFSTHTGEYAYQCSQCRFFKPYKADIQSHQLHSKHCRGKQINILYSYPKDIMTIYIYSCSICNFVQLNKANVNKHLKDHHPDVRDENHCIKKHILTAMAGEDENYIFHEAGDMVESENQDNFNDTANKLCESYDVPVTNEPLIEDSYINNSTNMECGSFNIHDMIASNPHCQPVQSDSFLTEPMDSLTVKSEFCLVPQNQELIKRSSLVIMPYLTYKSYQENQTSFGLFKCMASDCFYCTDVDENMVHHLESHSKSFCPPDGYLLCPYCNYGDVTPNLLPSDLVTHMREKHQTQKYQCAKCYYRSLTPENILIHSQMVHQEIKDNKVFKCNGSDLHENVKITDICKNMGENIAPIACSYCLANFFAISSLRNHMETSHVGCVFDVSQFMYFTCIYCSKDISTKEKAQEHLASMHPDKYPYVCYRELLKKHEGDALRNLSVWKDHTLKYEIVDVNKKGQVETPEKTDSEIVTQSPKKASISQVEALADVKPDVQGLLEADENLVTVLLYKLVSATGIPSNILYQCPIKSCEGFFLNFENWEKHMQKRHSLLIANCTHCNIELPLTNFKKHFELHCQHSYVCFTCFQTFVNEGAIKQHMTDHHKEIVSFHFEKLNQQNTNCFHIVLNDQDRFIRNELIAQLKERLTKYLKELEIKNEEVNTEWSVPLNAEWLAEAVIVKRCLFPKCEYRTTDDDDFFNHIRTGHKLGDRRFTCGKCQYAEESVNWDSLESHLRSHPDERFLCGVCSYNTSGKMNMSRHIREVHNYRDVAVIFFSRLRNKIKIKISVVFAEKKVSFSTIMNCFCCEEVFRSHPKTYSLHLKHFHNVMLKYYCEHCDEKLNKLNDYKQHFEEKHINVAVKIRCELGTKHFININSLRPLKFNVNANQPKFMIQTSREGNICIKKEAPDENDALIIMDDDDIYIEGASKTDPIEAPKSAIKLKCVDVNKLVQPSMPIISNCSTLTTTNFIPIRPKVTPFISAVASNSTGNSSNSTIQQRQSSSGQQGCSTIQSSVIHQTAPVQNMLPLNLEFLGNQTSITLSTNQTPIAVKNQTVTAMPLNKQTYTSSQQFNGVRIAEQRRNSASDTRHISVLTARPVNHYKQINNNYRDRLSSNIQITAAPNQQQPIQMNTSNSLILPYPNMLNTPQNIQQTPYIDSIISNNINQMGGNYYSEMRNPISNNQNTLSTVSNFLMNTTNPYQSQNNFSNSSATSNASANITQSSSSNNYNTTMIPNVTNMYQSCYSSGSNYSMPGNSVNPTQTRVPPTTSSNTIHCPPQTNMLQGTTHYTQFERSNQGRTIAPASNTNLR